MLKSISFYWPRTPVFPRWSRGNHTRAAWRFPHSEQTNRNEHIKEMHNIKFKANSITSLITKNIPEKPEFHVRWVPELKRLPVPFYPAEITIHIRQKIWTLAHIQEQSESSTNLVKTIIMNSHVVQERCFFNVLHLGFWCSECELLFVHVWNVTENIVTSSLRNHLEKNI